jgi:hypothetical protein
MLGEGDATRVVLHHQSFSVCEIFLGIIVVIYDVSAAGRIKSPHNIFLMSKLVPTLDTLIFALFDDNQFIEFHAFFFFGLFPIYLFFGGIAKVDVADFKGAVSLSR